MCVGYNMRSDLVAKLKSKAAPANMLLLHGWIQTSGLGQKFGHYDLCADNIATRPVDVHTNIHSGALNKKNDNYTVTSVGE